MPLTDSAVRHARPRERVYRLNDGRGLVLLIQPNGSKWWRFRYRWQGVEQMLSMGTYPDTPLVLARTRRDDARQQLAKGIDPGAARRKARDPVDRSFRGVAQHWLAGLENLVRAGKRSEKTLSNAKWALETYVFPDLGRRGDQYNPAIGTSSRFEENRNRGAIDLINGQWRISHRHMKRKIQHIVPLSRQAIDILLELRTLTGEGDYVFPCLGHSDRPMSGNTIDKALRIMGFSGDEMTGQGFRTLASTLLVRRRAAPEFAGCRALAGRKCSGDGDRRRADGFW